MRYLFRLRSTLTLITLLLSTLLCCTPAGAENNKHKVAQANDTEITLLEDCDQPLYSSNMHNRLESKAPANKEYSKDWALTRFVIKRNGTLEDISLCNSTGNQKFDSAVLGILHSVKLPPLPAECPDRVKTTHAFGYRKAWKNTKAPSTKSSDATATTEETSKETAVLASGFRDGLKSASKQLGIDLNEQNLANIEALANIIANLIEIGAIVLFFSVVYGGTGALVFSFFAAGTVWYLHRVVFGRFPS
jgi:hypothetical protein